MSPDKGKSKSGKTRADRNRTQQQPVTPCPSATTPNLVWTLRPATQGALKEWEAAKASEPDLIAAEEERLRNRPLDRSANPRRTGQLRGSLSHRVIGEKKLPQWQQEITGAGRVWYCPDKDERIVWVTKVSLSHPKATE